MDKEKIEELKKRRVLLQEEVRLKELRQRIALELNYLEERNYNYKVYYNYEHVDWIKANVQIRKRDGYHGIYDDFQIDVDDSTQDDTLYYEKDLLSDEFKAQFLSYISNETSLIVCYQGGAPEIEISVEAFLSQPLKFFSRPENWIITKDETWIIESIWDQGVIRFIRLQKSLPILVEKFRIQYK